MSLTNRVLLKQRIVAKAKKSGIPTVSTRFWEDAPPHLKTAIEAAEPDPVLYSISGNGDTTIVGTTKVLIVRDDTKELICLADIRAIDCHELTRGKQKVQFELLEIVTKNGKTYSVPTEKGAPCFAIWGILLMLMQMNTGE